MTPTESSALLSEPSEPTAAEQRESSIREHETRNLWTLAVHYVVLRTSWIFKTESVIMPAFVDAIAGAGWIRGCLPVLNRFGQSIPPLLFSDSLRNAPQKKRALMVTSLLMALPFLTLSAIWFVTNDKRQVWLPPVFLLLYALFFSSTGLNQLSFGTLQGKLIRAERRGRLLGLSGIVGSIFAVTCGWFILRAWLGLPDGGFGYIFAFTGTGFVIAGLTAIAICEPADEAHAPRKSGKHQFAEAWNVFRRDCRFRRAAVVAMLFITIQFLFPHFQALGREGLTQQQQAFHLMVWVVAQNAAVGFSSFWSGYIADRCGNRLAVRLQVFATALTPLLAIALAGRTFGGHNYFWIAFCLLGFTPVTMKTLVNYTLELADPVDHPRYVSTMSLCLAIPCLLSPLVGGLVDLLGFRPVFVFISLCIALGGLLTFRMAEPRHSRPDFDD